ncbi:D-glycero-beta-D-manno-heptose-1,7-bisphosphate 7-phosphatase [Anoxybacter fermentans]|uniref:D,D-heptose 1,7-bisphosphate phosphatase n=1 Tax=Anoxybacter fermentans TaxID=1323375 RepID=A0A3S9SZ82_9FIRM|nr:HAD family hydrolase [Anoxybacter fermentans]AZR73609.1 D-glycero-beta-D-manno-heptose-1,7-bisphosphate 7-phosphatase [Anoxybacter fermentans]
MSKKAVFLDRDGVINDNSRHVNKPEDLILYPWTASSIQQLKKAGYLVFIVTNQGGIEMGYFTEKDLKAIHDHLETILKADNTCIDGIAYCPHFHQPCDCRKPKPGMILTLAKKHRIDLKVSWMVGDRDIDIQAGKAAGCRTIKLGKQDPNADYCCKNLRQAVDYILRQT